VLACRVDTDLRASDTDPSTAAVRTRTALDVNVTPGPATTPLIVRDTRTSSAPAAAMIRAATCTAMPPMRSPRTSTSPRCIPARIRRSSPATLPRSERAQAMALAGPSNVASIPSPARSTTRPLNRPISRSVTSWCRSRSRRRSLSPSRVARSGDPTMSVKSTDASVRSMLMSSGRSPVMNSSIRPSASSPIMCGRWSAPSNKWKSAAAAAKRGSAHGRTARQDRSMGRIKALLTERPFSAAPSRPFLPPVQRRSEQAAGPRVEKCPARHHWITSSARWSTDCGIVNPRALAVLRLITSSNLVGCSTGRSAGLAPLRILSTNTAARLCRSG